ncbi:MAG: 5-formyltetrahydrofolate cyclo-ligase [Micromonosporaceae bacterium]
MADAQMGQLSEKSAVRAAALAARRALDAQRRAEADQALADRTVTLLRARGITVVAAYVPMTGEPGGLALLPALAAGAELVLLPVREPDGDLDWAPYAGPAMLTPTRPSEPTTPRLGRDAIRRAGLVLVPAVAVDRTGMRLGRGGGSYDRALPRVDPTVPVLALLYDGEVAEHVPAQAHDRPVRGVLTPTGELWFGPAP